MIFTVLNIPFSKEQLRQLISMTDTNRDGKIDAKEFHAMLYADDLAQLAEAEAAAKEAEMIEVVEEVSNESDDEEIDEDEEIKNEITAGMIENRNKVM